MCNNLSKSVGNTNEVSVSRTMLLDHDEGNARSQAKAVETQHYQPGHGEQSEATTHSEGVHHSEGAYANKTPTLWFPILSR
jgi:hypothetical protein